MRECVSCTCARHDHSRVSAGALSEEGLLLYLRGLQALLLLLPVFESSSRTEVSSDSEDDDTAGIQSSPMQVRRSNTAPQRLMLSSELMLHFNSVLFLKGTSFSSRTTAESLCS